MLTSLPAESGYMVFCHCLLSLTAPSQLLLVLLRPVKQCKALEEFPFSSQRNTELYWVFNINFILL